MTINLLQDKLAQAIQQFNNCRATILSDANVQGGQDAVTALENKYDELNSQYCAMLAADLDENNAAYSGLSDDANAQVDLLQASVANLTSVNDAINALSSVISIVAKIVTLV